MRKLIAILKWFVIVVGVLLFSLTAYVLFIPAWSMRNWRYNILWIYLDDGLTDYLVPEAYLNEKGLKQNWWGAYKYNGVRNRIWNIYDYKWIQLKEGTIHSEEKAIDELYRDGKKISPRTFATIRYIDGKYVGTVLDIKKSVLGVGLSWFMVGNTLYFRYSFAKVIEKKNKLTFSFKNGFERKDITIYKYLQAGVDKKYSFKYKINKVIH